MSENFLNFRIHGPYFNKTIKRNVVDIVDNESKKITRTTYARFLMMKKIGRILTKEEHVDHKDENKNNDDINNLQILSILENTLKSRTINHQNGVTYVRYICPVCGKVQNVKVKTYNERTKNNRFPLCDSAACAGYISGQRRRGETPSNHILNEDYYVTYDDYVFNILIIGFFI